MKVIFKPDEMDGKIPISYSGSLIKPRFPNSVMHNLCEQNSVCLFTPQSTRASGNLDCECATGILYNLFRTEIIRYQVLKHILSFAFGYQLE